MSTELVTAGTITFTREQKDLIKRTFAQGSTDDEFALFIATAERMGLRPEARQIHMVKRKTKEGDSYVEKMSIQTGIDGYRLIADRTGRYAPGRESTFTYDADGRLVSATAYVRKLVAGEWHECAATAHFREYAQTYRRGNEMVLTQMWESKPHIMLSKCAEALALRRAFPAELSGIYTDEEMAQADTPPVDAPTSSRTSSQTVAGHSKPSLDALKDALAAAGNDANAQHAIASERGDAVLASRLLTAIEDARSVFKKNGKATAAEIETATANLRALVAEAKQATAQEAQPE